MSHKSVLRSILYKSKDGGCDRVIILDPKGRGSIVAQYSFRNDSDAKFIYKCVRENLTQIIENGREKKSLEIEDIHDLNRSIFAKNKRVNRYNILDNSRAIEGENLKQNYQKSEISINKGIEFIGYNSNQLDSLQEFTQNDYSIDFSSPDGTSNENYSIFDIFHFC